MENQKDLTRIIQNICKSALHGELKLEKFYELWPEEANDNSFLKQIYDDVEDGVAHLPGTWLTGKILSKEWYRSNMYHILYLDSILLTFDKGTDELMRCREYVIRQKELSVEIIKKRVNDFFERSSDNS